MNSPIPLVDLAAGYEEIREEVEPILLARLRSGDYLGADTIAAFEAEFAAYVGGGCEAVACSSGTDAVELMVRACCEPGATIAIDPHTFIAQVAGIERAGCRAVQATSCDAVIATWLYGSTARADDIAALCREHGVPLLEDASQAHGNKRAGTIGDAAAWSCYPSKNLGAAGQAGVVTFKDSAAAARARRLREHGYDRRTDRHWSRGFNMRMDAVQADILRVKLKRLDRWVARRREIAAAYIDALRDVTGLGLPENEPDHAWHIFSVRVSRDRDGVINKLRDRGVMAAVHYRRDAFGRECSWSRENLSIPLYPQMTDAQVSRVVEAVRGCV